MRTLVDAWLPAGRQALRWDGRDASGATVPAGFYFVRGAVGGQVVQKRLVRLE